jgi:surface antigen
MNDNVVLIAKSYLNKYEKKNNSGFIDAEFEKKMKAVGWGVGQSWCAYFTELVWKEAFKVDAKISVEYYQSLDKLFSGSATATFANFSHSSLFKTGSTPKIGALSVWKHGNSWKGHIGIVSEIIDATTYKCIEGNTNSAGGREGIQVAEKVRKTGQPFKANGLNLIGFVYLPQ